MSMQKQPLMVCFWKRSHCSWESKSSLFVCAGAERSEAIEWVSLVVG